MAKGLNIVSEAGSLATGGGETAPDLVGVVDHPLEAGEGTDHEDTGAETLPEAVHADSTVDLSDALASLVHDGDTGVGGVGNDGAEDTSAVSGHEGDHHLGALAVLVLRLGEDVGVEHGDELLEGHELDNGVGDLSGPERLDALKEGVTRSVLHLLVAGQGAARPLGLLDSRVRGLHADFQRFPRAEEDVSDELGASGGDRPADLLVLGGVGAGSTGIDILEDLVEAELAEALSRVTEEGRAVANGEALEALGRSDVSDALSDTFVQTRVGLKAALDQIEGSNNRVSDTAREDTTHHALAVVREVVNV